MLNIHERFRKCPEQISERLAYLNLRSLFRRLLLQTQSDFVGLKSIKV